MPSLDFILPAKDGRALSKTPAPATRDSQDRAGEPFDALMNRAMGKSRNDKGTSTRDLNAQPGIEKDPGANRSRQADSNSRAESLSPDAAASAPDPEPGVQQATGKTGEGTSSDKNTASAATDVVSTEQPAECKQGDATVPVMVACAPPVVVPPVTTANGSLNGPEGDSQQNPVLPGGTRQSNNPVSCPGTSKGDGARDASGAVITDKSGNGTNPQKAGNPALVTSSLKASGSGDAANLPANPSAMGGVATQDSASSAEAAATSVSPGVEGLSETGRNSAAKREMIPEIETGGISAAQQTATMKNSENTPKIAGPAEKDLPGVTLPAGGEDLSAREKPAINPISRLESQATTLTVTASVSDRVSTPSEASSTASISPLSNPDFSARLLERTHDAVAMHSLRLRDSSADSLHVVIKPGDGVQLSLELHQRAGGIEAQASVNSGDFDQLNRHWAELQERLQQRGIRLAPLVCQDNAAGSGDTGSQQQQRRPDGHDPLSAGAFAEFALAGSMTETPARRAARAAAYRGWETWA